MAKSLKDLLGEFKFQNETFNPRNVTPDMLSSKEIAREVNIKGLSVSGVKIPYDKQYSLLTNNIVDIYGADAPRILLRGAVDLNKATKKIVNRAARIAGGIFGNNNAVGSFVRNSITGLVSVKQPSDTISGNSTENGLYSDILNARVDNSKNPITGLLTQFKTPSQFKAAVGDISNGKVKIGGAVVNELTNLSFKGLGWAAAKIGLGKQDAGKTKSLSQTLTDSTNSNLASVARFPSIFAESKAKINKEDKPTGIVIGQDQFAKLQDFPNMYDDSPIKTALTTDGAVRNIRTSTGLAENYDDYLTRNPSEKSNFVRVDRFNTRAGEMTQDSQLGFNPNSVITVNRAQSFRGIYNNYQLAKTSGTTLNVGEGSSASFTDRMEGITKSDSDTFLLVKSSTADEDFIYKIPDIISEGKPKRFSEKVLDPSGQKINYYLFGGYSNRKAKTIKGDHRLKSLNTFKEEKGDDKKDLITISMNGIALMSNITGLTDTPTPSWGEAKGIGSPYKFYFYESFEREISFKAQIYATSERNLPLVWKKANQIMKLTDGQANGSKGIKGNIITLKIGDIINCSAGFLTSCTLSVPDISPWEIQEGKQAPFVCELDITYKVIHANNNLYDDLKTEDNPLFIEDKSKSPGAPSEPSLEEKLETLKRKTIERKRAEEADLMKLEAGMALDAETQNFIDTENREYLRSAIKNTRIKGDTADLLNSNINFSDFGQEAGLVSQQTSFVNDAVRNAIQTRQGELLNESFGPVAFDASINAISGQNVDDIVRRAINNRTSTSALGGAN
jgi:hypothetical protein